jgi:hypothetical protein
MTREPGERFRLASRAMSVFPDSRTNKDAKSSPGCWNERGADRMRSTPSTAFRMLFPTPEAGSLRSGYWQKPKTNNRERPKGATNQ